MTMADTITILTTSGPRLEAATIVGPLAVHRSLRCRNHYCISHLASGARIPADFKTKSSAVAAASEISRIKNYWDSLDPDDYRDRSFVDRAKEIIARYGGVLSRGPSWDGERIS